MRSTHNKSISKSADISLRVINGHTLCTLASPSSTPENGLVSCRNGIYPGEFPHSVCEVACYAYKGPKRTGFDPSLDQHRYSKPNQPSINQIASFAQAVTVGIYVANDIALDRAITCATCDYYRYDDNGPWCGVCGCRVSAQSRKIRNLAAYEEHLPGWGCKHPQRLEGKGWKFVKEIDRIEYEKYLMKHKKITKSSSL